MSSCTHMRRSRQQRSMKPDRGKVCIWRTTSSVVQLRSIISSLRQAASEKGVGDFTGCGQKGTSSVSAGFSHSAEPARALAPALCRLIAGARNADTNARLHPALEAYHHGKQHDWLA